MYFYSKSYETHITKETQKLQLKCVCVCVRVYLTNSLASLLLDIPQI